MAEPLQNWQIGGFGLYIHWPFCQSKCPYCDFNSHVTSRIDQDRWGRAYLAELDRVAVETSGRVLTSVFFGGGTPSLMDPALVTAILDRVAKNWTVSNDFEVTLEANPTSIEADRFSGYRSGGVSRVSMGMQALNDPDLRRLGRLHSVSEGLKAFDIARNAFDRVSFDLIYARQDQTLSEWESELGQALDLTVDHLSLYQLTVEAGTAFGDRLAAGRLRGLPDEDRSADMYELTQQMTEAAGFPNYEISNHARPGSESRHNLIYWRSGDWIGVGPGAHGRLTLGATRWATEAPKAPGLWLQTVENGEAAELPRETVSAEAQREERLMMGLRLREGVGLDRVLPADQAAFHRKVNDLERLGLLEMSDHRIAVTASGRPVLNAVLRELLVD